MDYRWNFSQKEQVPKSGHRGPRSDMPHSRHEEYQSTTPLGKRIKLEPHGKIDERDSFIHANTDPQAYYKYCNYNRKKVLFTREMRMKLHQQFADLRRKHFPERKVDRVTNIPCSQLGSGIPSNKDDDDDDDEPEDELSSGEIISSEEVTTSDTTSTDELLDSGSDNDSDMEDLTLLSHLSSPDRLHRLLAYNENTKHDRKTSCNCKGYCSSRGVDEASCEGEQKIDPCEPCSNNIYRLHHYKVVISPSINFKLDLPSFINHMDRTFEFAGFSLFSHQRLDQIPGCSLQRFRREYNIRLVPDVCPQNIWVKDMDLISDYILKDILEVYDFDCGASRTSCCRPFHFYPRYEFRSHDSEIPEILGSDIVLAHLLTSFELLFETPLSNLGEYWRHFSRSHRNSIVAVPEKRPRALRIDDIYECRPGASDSKEPVGYGYPELFHVGTNNAEAEMVRSKSYCRLLKRIKLLNKRVNTRPGGDNKNRRRLAKCQEQLNRLRSNAEREVEVLVSSRGFWKIGIAADVCQHALILPAIAQHIKYHWSLGCLETKLNHTFKNKSLLEISLTHQSYDNTYGANPTHIRISMANCGVRQPSYGEHKKSYTRTKKRGLLYLVNTMSNLGSTNESYSNIKFNESLEFLGDAVLDLICSTRLFYMLKDSSEGTLSIFRSALVQNCHLLNIAKNLEVQKYMLISNCNKLEEAVAGCMEALLAVVYLEDGMYEAEKFITYLIFGEEDLREVWLRPMIHPLQEEHPAGDRFFIETSNVLQNLVTLEKETGLKFKHIRLLAKAFMHPAAGLNSLTRGDNQRLEFLGDSVLKFIVADYVYKHFPNHHDGHLTLLKNSMVSSKCQARVACDLGLHNYIDFGTAKKMPRNTRQKLLADVFEAFIGAVYIDKNLRYCRKICEVCLFTRLETVIVNQDWIDPKSQLQSCCLTLPSEPGMSRYPRYKVLQERGSSDDKYFKVAVYMQKRRLGTGRGKSKREAEMDAAQDALQSNYFEVMRKQKRILDRKHGSRRWSCREKSDHSSE